MDFLIYFIIEVSDIYEFDEYYHAQNSGRGEWHKIARDKYDQEYNVQNK